jgi:hypothetical protein
MTGTSARMPFRICLIAPALILAALVSACDIPVCDYTLQNWLRDAYRVSYFYSGTEAARDVPVNIHLQRAAEEAGFHANLTIKKVNVGGGGATPHNAAANQLPPRHKSRKLPFHTVITPRGTELFAGRLNLADARALVQSPLRKQLARDLCQGKNGLLLILLGPDRTQNAAAKKIVPRIIAHAREQDLDVGMLQVRRDDAEEKWFVEQLLSLEDDLKQLDDTMVFGVFGRGHVMAPYLGKGITEANINTIVTFMNGPCACEIKTSSPGMDMLTAWQWDTAAACNRPAPERPIHSALFDVPAESRPPTPQPPTAEPTRPLHDTDHNQPAAHPATKPPTPPNAAVNAQQPPAQFNTHPRQEPHRQTGAADIPPTVPNPPPPSTHAQPEEAPLSTVAPRQSGAATQTSSDASMTDSDGPHLAKLLSVRLGAILAAATVLLLAASLAIMRRRRSQ